MMATLLGIASVGLVILILYVAFGTEHPGY